MSTSALGSPRRRRSQPGWGSTAIGIAILAVMLFPLYWMINVSLQPGGSAVGTPWVPIHLSFSGYSTALSQQGRNLVTSLAVAPGGIPFAVLITRAFMGNTPREVVEAARVDGAGHVRAFVSVVLPMSRNALVTAGLFTFLFAWADFLFALTLTTTEDVRPVTLGLYTYIGTYVNDWSAVMATAVLASIPAILLLVVAQRYVAVGTTAGAVK